MTALLRFGVFEVDFRLRELRKRGIRLHLPEQSFEILTMLVERPGDVITREEIRERLWPHGTVVEFEHSVNSAVKRLRDCLGDSATTPRFIETLPRRGYRFAAPVESVSSCPTSPHFRILGELGRGGMGVVYKAEDLILGRTVALKFLPEEMARHTPSVERFRREARTVASINHPGICSLYGVEEHEGRLCLVMEYLEGQPLGRLIAGGPLALKQALEIAAQAAEALGAAHSFGIVHHDITPANIFVSGEGLVKILDFGLAQIARRETAKDDVPTGTPPTAIPEHNLTDPVAADGTTAYLSPEQTVGNEADARSDIFSLGTVLYEMVTGTHPFRKGSARETISAILDQEPKPVSATAQAIPSGLEKLISRCLHKDPAERFQHMVDLKIALDNLINEEFESDARKTAGMAKPKLRHRIVWVSAVASVLVIAAVVFWYPRSKGVVPAAPIAVIPLTSYPGDENSPSFSPDGNNVAFSWNGEQRDNVDIYVMQIDSHTYHRLTTDPARDANPAFSPNGQSIAFVRVFEDNRRSAIILIPSMGGPERALVEFDPGEERFLSWFPDGKWIATGGLTLVSVETGEIRKLTSPPTDSEGDYTPAVSPDGRTIAFARGTHVVSEIYLLDLTSDLRPKGEAKQLTHMQHRSIQPAWTADGREIIFTCEEAWEWRLWRVPASGSGDPRRLLTEGDQDGGSAISPPGNRLAFRRAVSDRNIYRLPLLELGVQQGLPEHFLQSTRDEINPKYSPNGRLITFESNRAGVHGIWVSHADGSNPVEIAGSGLWPRWSPDGQRIVFGSRVEGPTCIYVVRASGGRPDRLTSGPDDDSPSFSRDGKWIYFSRVQNGQAQIWKVPAGGGEAVQITADGGYWPVESHDGRFLYYMRPSNNTLCKIPAGGGVGIQVLPSVSMNYFELMDDGIYFVAQPNKDGKEQLQFFNFSTKTIKKITALPDQLTFGFAVSPDRRWVLYTTDDVFSSDLMLVENFR